MEILALLDLCGCFFDGFTALAWLFDIVLWIQGAPNRTARREARREGQPPPARDYWSLAVFAVTVLALLLTVVLVWKYWRWWAPRA
jgi:hypothetical protein